MRFLPNLIIGILVTLLGIKAALDGNFFISLFDMSIAILNFSFFFIENQLNDENEKKSDDDDFVLPR